MRHSPMLLTASLALVAAITMAADFTWTGGGQAPKKWSDPANWDGGGAVPGAGDNVFFGPGGGSGDVTIGKGSLITASGATALLNVGADWTLPNQIGGGGTLNVGTFNSSADRILTLGGSEVDLGVGAEAGIFKIGNGNTSKKTDVVLAAASGRKARVIVDITGDGEVAGTDFDQLSLTKGNLSGLADAELVLRFAEGLTPEDFDGQELEIIRCLDGTVSGTFGAVSAEPDNFAAKLRYDSDAVVVTDIRTGIKTTLILIR